MCKLYASEVGTRVASKAISILGAVGYQTGPYPVERIWRDVKLCEIGEGTSEIQRLVIARELLKEIQKRFGRRLGKLAKPSSRHSYPMMQLLAQKQVEGRAVLLGNSAHTIHPNGAQGFNLCLRDVAGLAEHLLQDSTLAFDPGDKQLLENYFNSRLQDQQRVSRLSHGMTRWFYNNQICRAATRNVAMTLVDLVPPAKAGLMRRGMGIWGRQPALVRGLEL